VLVNIVAEYSDSIVNPLACG